jgi:hypothetical protein
VVSVTVTEARLDSGITRPRYTLVLDFPEYEMPNHFGMFAKMRDWQYGDLPHPVDIPPNSDTQRLPEWLAPFDLGRTQKIG